jgi:hypothetical protein
MSRRQVEGNKRESGLAVARMVEPYDVLMAFRTSF